MNSPTTFASLISTFPAGAFPSDRDIQAVHYIASRLSRLIIRIPRNSSCEECTEKESLLVALVELVMDIQRLGVEGWKGFLVERGKISDLEETLSELEEMKGALEEAVGRLQQDLVNRKAEIKELNEVLVTTVENAWRHREQTANQLERIVERLEIAVSQLPTRSEINTVETPASEPAERITRHQDPSLNSRNREVNDSAKLDDRRIFPSHSSNFVQSIPSPGTRRHENPFAEVKEPDSASEQRGRRPSATFLSDRQPAMSSAARPTSLKGNTQLRGGALGTQRRCFVSAANSPPNSSRQKTLANVCGVSGSVGIDTQAYTRNLELQNASHLRMIKQLHDIIKDAEETIQWQDEQLGLAYDHIDHLKGRLSWQTEEHGQRPISGAPRNQRSARMRGGANETGENDISNTHQISASAFYFFPSVSILVLLTYPPRYFQWPENTSLAQVRDFVMEGRYEGMEDGEHLDQARKIFEAREKMAIALPNTSSGRQILISAPASEGNSPVIQPSHYAATRFGDYEYEKMLKRSIENLRVPIANDRSHLSPESSTAEETFIDASDLINEINTISRVASENKLTSLVKEISEPRSVVSTGFRRKLTETLPMPPTSLPLHSHSPFELSGCASPPYSDSVCGVKLHGSIENLSERSQDVDELYLSPTSGYERGHGRSRASSYSIISREYELSSSCEEVNQMHEAGEKENETARKIEDEDDEWEMWRHKKGEGCEYWLNHSRLDENRDRCTFCDLPFVQSDWRKWEFSDNKDNSGTAPDSSLPDLPSPYLRGGAPGRDFDSRCPHPVNDPRQRDGSTYGEREADNGPRISPEMKKIKDYPSLCVLPRTASTNRVNPSPVNTESAPQPAAPNALFGHLAAIRAHVNSYLTRTTLPERPTAANPINSQSTRRAPLLDPSSLHPEPCEGPGPHFFEQVKQARANMSRRQQDARRSTVEMKFPQPDTRKEDVDDPFSDPW